MAAGMAVPCDKGWAFPALLRAPGGCRMGPEAAGHGLRSRLAHRTAMMKVPRMVLLPASATVMVSVPFLRRTRPVKVWTPWSDAVKVYLGGSRAPCPCWRTSPC